MSEVRKEEFNQLLNCFNNKLWLEGEIKSKLFLSIDPKNISLDDFDDDENVKETGKLCKKCNKNTFVNTIGCMFKCNSCGHEEISEYPPNVSL